MSKEKPNRKKIKKKKKRLILCHFFYFIIACSMMSTRPVLSQFFRSFSVSSSPCNTSFDLFEIYCKRSIMIPGSISLFSLNIYFIKRIVETLIHLPYLFGYINKYIYIYINISLLDFCCLQFPCNPSLVCVVWRGISIKIVFYNRHLTFAPRSSNPMFWRERWDN